MYEGTCVCGRIGFRVSAPFKFIGNCHCDLCRVSHGADHATQGVVDDAAFEIVAGAEHLAAYESSPGYLRQFCAVCGSRLFNRHVVYGFHSVAVNALHGNPALEPNFHTYTKSKRHWVALNDDYPAFDEMPTGA